MRLHMTLLAIILAVAPANAEELSPWFGSEASQASQINLSDFNQPDQLAAEPITASADKECPIEGCPETSKPVKYNN